MASKVGECSYCGRTSTLTSDHIPPRNLFAKPWPPNLITVPACKSCNQSASKDDEYFRMVMALRYDTFENESVQKVYPSVLRSLKRSKARGLRKAFMSSLKEIDLLTPAGLYVGKTGQYDVKLSRLNRVASRIVKGLVFFELGKRLPDEYEVGAYVLDSFHQAPFETKRTIGNLINAVKNQSVKTVGNEVFSYRIRFMNDDEFASVVYFTIYDSVEFLGATGRPKLIKS